MDTGRKLPSAVQSFEPKHQSRGRNEAAEQHSTSSAPLVSPNPHVSDHLSSWNRSGMNSQPKGKSHGYSHSRPVRETKHDAQQRDRTTKDPQVKSKVNGDSPAQGRMMGRSSSDAQKRGFRGAAPAPNAVGKPKPLQNDSTPFEVKMADFPELAGASLGKIHPPSVKCWGPPPASNPQKQASMWKFDNRGSSTHPDVQQSAIADKPDSSAASPSQPVVSSWASVASQPPKKPTPDEKTLSSNHIQTEEIQEAGDPSKKKRRKKKKKTKGADEVESEAMNIYQEPPKFEDEEEFPGLTLALAGPGTLTSSCNAAKLYNEENQRERDSHPFVDLNREKQLEAQMLSAQAVKKAQNTEKVSGKKSKVPVQLDIGNMLAVLEKKQQSQKSKQDAKPVVFSVGGGLPVVQKQPPIQKKSPWQQDKIAHNPLDSTSPLVKKGKQREVPKAKKPTPLKKVILKEREERKQRRLLEERGLLPEDETKPVDDAAGEEQCDTNATEPLEEVTCPGEELDHLEFNGADEEVDEENEEPGEDQESTLPVPSAGSQHKIHSRKFRDYCSQMLSKDIDECVTDLLKELVRFQDRLYQKDPMKARMKRRLVMGLREVLKHLKLRKVKCIIISPNCERIESKGGLDEALHTIIDMCREQGVPFVFALSRKALGRCVNKAVPVSVVGIFNYDGAQDCYHKMIDLSSEARTAYEVMVTSQEKVGQSEQAVNTEKELQISSPANKTESSPHTQVEEPEYMQIWKKMLEKEYNHNILNFEEQLSSMHLDSECTENSDDDKS
ncbi:selenocysteine insertion sequence-binding protein 2-like isoform X2 [Betta splendens]|uniref:Selenocysteine insertion sequence-binding protein 2-like isoform X2 n=1 Tax=Betta splendens TaxID=158456 RepID=A0A6P7NG88_BETSP|nr:selenocysteine insertion sequence-binding protein 2-like isoform X2 [Betta splendens]